MTLIRDPLRRKSFSLIHDVIFPEHKRMGERIKMERGGKGQEEKEEVKRLFDPLGMELIAWDPPNVLFLLKD